MPKVAFHQPDNKASGKSASDAPDGQVYDSSYTTKGRRSDGPVPVLKDDDRVEDPINLKDADSDKQLERDDANAIDKSNMLKDRTRGEKPRESYKEPTDEDFGLTEGS